MNGEKKAKDQTIGQRAFGRFCPVVPTHEFSPAAVALHRSPPNPIARATLRLLFGLCTILVVWASIGRLDIVAVASGKLIPQTFLKIVQPSEAGIIREILVREGERVREGQVLLRMDPTLTSADLNVLGAEHRRLLLSQRRIDAELNNTLFAKLGDEDPVLFAEVAAQFTANRQSFESSLAEERYAGNQALQQAKAALEIRDKLEKTLPLYREQDDTYAKLAEQGYVGRLAAAEKRAERIEKEEEVQTQVFLIARDEAAVRQSHQRMEQLRNDYMRRLHNERSEVSTRIETLQQEIIKQQHRTALLELKAPRSGVVKSLGTHTAGTVTQPGTILMTLVPDDEPLIAEVWIENKDVGFVYQGQSSKVKLVTYQFQKYGMLDGVVTHVSADADEEESVTRRRETGGLAYRALVELSAQYLDSGGKTFRLVPGMQVSTEINLGTRTIFEYLLSPVRAAFYEAARER